ncbi:MAG: hypothetical protein WD708_01300 [Kiritimatiellia bacterium]
MKQRIFKILFALLLFLCTFGTGIAANYLILKEWVSPELKASSGLLLLNYGLFLIAGEVASSRFSKIGFVFGLLWVAAKLFVNTFTIFLFIGLQAVRTHVFVYQFLAAYTVLLMGGVWYLHWNSKLDTRRTHE